MHGGTQGVTGAAMPWVALDNTQKEGLILNRYGHERLKLKPYYNSLNLDEDKLRGSTACHARGH